LADKFTVKISGDKEISKSLSEWLDEIKEAKHEYAKLPGVVYEDILSGGAIVDIVEEANALPTIYNTVLTYINTLNEEEEFEIVDQDESNPPMTKVGPKTIAIIPGAFKPPHQGHADMVRKYASMADEVVVLISKPLKNVRGLPGGGEITAEDSLNIWQLLVGDLSNVTVGIFNDPAIRSPISAAYSIAGPVAERQAAASKVEPSIDPIEPGSTVILGASTKGGDASRWKRAEEYVGEDLILKNPLDTAVKPTDRPSGGSYNASDMRELLGDPQNNMLELEDFIGKGNVPALLGILGLGVEEPLEEMSSGAGGAVGGYSGPLGSTSDEPGKRDKRKKKKNENIDMSLVNEVFELLIERGIVL
jgi:cytidyltransferase-like protein